LNQQENVPDQIAAVFKEWVDDVASNEKLFKEHVYDNGNLTDFDIRQHRARLYAMLSDGETLAIAFTKWLEAEKSTQTKEQVKQYLDLLDKKLKELLQTLFAWHGDFHSQADVPDSLKQAINEADSGNLVDFEDPK
jgi:hypothetical protein